MFGKYKKLKKDIAAFPYPVFGLRKSVYDLAYVEHYEDDGRFTIYYQSRSKPPYQFFGRSLWTFSLESSLYMHEGPLSVVHDTSLYPSRDETIQEEETTQEVFEIFVMETLWNRDLDIDGIRFKGEMRMRHTEDPFNMAGWCYSSESGHYHIDGRAFGLSYEEVIGILSALRKLK